ncbi:MAG: hypothetical protein LBF40_10720 [Deltaproteobacteria bacterium]|jgi:hypothetical protein|nr:hypothetical protein [Deltaproteobacteria bacterium]
MSKKPDAPKYGIYIAQVTMDILKNKSGEGYLVRNSARQGKGDFYSRKRGYLVL